MYDCVVELGVCETYMRVCETKTHDRLENEVFETDMTPCERQDVRLTCSLSQTHPFKALNNNDYRAMPNM